MKYELIFIGVFSEALPRDMFLQNIQKMVYIKIDNQDVTLVILKEILYAQIKDPDQRLAIDDWINYQYESQEASETVTDDTVVVFADGIKYIQFDLRCELLH